MIEIYLRKKWKMPCQRQVSCKISSNMKITCIGHNPYVGTCDGFFFKTLVFRMVIKGGPIYYQLKACDFHSTKRWPDLLLETRTIYLIHTKLFLCSYLNLVLVRSMELILQVPIRSVGTPSPLCPSHADRGKSHSSIIS